MNSLNVFLEHIYEGAQQNGLSVAHVLEYARACGIDGLECDYYRIKDDNEFIKMQDLIGIYAKSIYCQFDFGHKERSECRDDYMRVLETSAKNRCRKVLAVPGFVYDCDDSEKIRFRIAENLSCMCDDAKKYDITVSLEDFDDKVAPYSTSEGLLWFMKNVDGLGFTFDTGNFAYSLEDAEEAYDMLSPWIKHVHLKDRSWDKSRADSSDTNGKATLDGKIMYPCEVGGGFIGIEGLVKRLVADGYDGSMSIEHFGAVSQLEYMKKSAENIRKYLDL